MSSTSPVIDEVGFCDLHNVTQRTDTQIFFDKTKLTNQTDKTKCWSKEMWFTKYCDSNKNVGQKKNMGPKKNFKVKKIYYREKKFG